MNIMNDHTETHQEKSPYPPEYARALLNALSAHVAVIDEQGIIVDTNLAWKNFGLSNEIRMAPETIGINYLTVCDNALGEDARRSREVSKGIRQVIQEKLKSLPLNIPVTVRTGSAGFTCGPPGSGDAAPSGW